ncbi:hypothetical protein [Metabacillus sp. RGM 3146]
MHFVVGTDRKTAHVNLKKAYDGLVSSGEKIAAFLIAEIDPFSYSRK